MLMLELEGDMLAALWPADRVMLGVQVCKTLHAALALAPAVRVDVLSGHAKAILGLDAGAQRERVRAISRSLMRFDGHGVHACSRDCSSASSLLLSVLESAVASGWRGVAHLEVRRCKVGQEPATSGDVREIHPLDQTAMLSSLLASSRCLTALDLYDNMLGPQGARALAAALSASPALPCLRHLELGSNGIGDDGLLALAGAVSQCRQLESLGMGHNAVADAAPALAPVLQASARTLRHVCLGRNRIPDAALAGTLGALGACSALVSLDLGGNRCARVSDDDDVYYYIRFEGPSRV